MSPAAPRILVIRRRYLGDIVLLGPVFRNLRRHWPKAHIAALVESAYASVLALNPDVDEAFVLPRRWTAWPGFIARLRKAAFTHVLDLDNNDRTALLTRLTGAPLRAALHHDVLRRGFCYTTDVYHPPEIHERTSIVDYYLAALSAAGVPIVTREVRLVPRPADVADARRLVQPGGRKVLVHPGSRSAWRIWPAENFAAVCDRLQEELGAQVFLIGGPGEQDLARRIGQLARSHVIAVKDAIGVPQFAAFAAEFDVMLCHDSGPMHVAAAVGTPVVALLGSQNPVLFAPAGEGHAVLQPPLPCVACVSPGQCVPGDSYRNHCVRNITVDAVFAAVRDRLV
ncbi:MAG TPA: glycosyltransferase family 9 protein [Opitutaceae bacterium]|nr:glycosyltransferase family 9 protein [Opitutaceae bacterium]